MTATVETSRDSADVRARWAPVAGLVAYLIGAAGNIMAGDGEQGPGGWLAAFGIAAAVTVIAVLGARWALARGSSSTSTAAAVSGVLAAVGIVVFWAGVPAVFGAAAIGLALAVRAQRGSFTGPALVGLIVGGAALLMSVAGLIGGW